MRTLVLYYSEYGHTKRYAQWIAESLKADILEIHQCSLKMALDYDNIIFGTSVYADRLKNFSFITQNLSQLMQRKLILFTVSLGEFDKEKRAEMLVANSFPKDCLSSVPCFSFRGGVDFSKLSWLHCTMMKVPYLMLKLKRNKTSKEEEFLKTFFKTKDFVSKEALQPLLDLVQQC